MLLLFLGGISFRCFFSKSRSEMSAQPLVKIIVDRSIQDQPFVMSRDGVGRCSPSNPVMISFAVRMKKWPGISWFIQSPIFGDIYMLWFETRYLPEVQRWWPHWSKLIHGVSTNVLYVSQRKSPIWGYMPKMMWNSSHPAEKTQHVGESGAGEVSRTNQAGII